MSKLKKRILALGMTLVMTLTMIPMFASIALADEASATIKVDLTVSNQGEFAKANDGTVMGQKEVTVTDLDEDGKFTFDEALVAAHAAYNSADGYTVSSGQVKKLWGVETTNTLFFTNGKGLSTGVTADTIQDGDVLLASINKDNTYWSDWYTAFDQPSVEATYGDDVTLVLSGYQGMMSYMSPEMAPVAGVTIKTADGAVLGTTDESGTVTFQTPAAGEYIITAEGTVKDAVTDWNLMNYKTMDYTVDGTAFVTFDWDTFDTFVAYTEEDHGDGPYPADEVKFIPMYDDEGKETEWESLHYLKSNQLLADCPIMAPCCKMIVCPTEFTYYGDDLAVINADGKAFGMWTPQEGSTVSLEGDNVVLHIIPKNKTVYGGFIWGSIHLIPDDLKSEDAELDFATNEDGTLDITLSKDYCGKATPIAPIKKKGGTTSEQYYLAIPSANKLIVDEMDDIQQAIDELQKQLDELKEQLTVKPGWNKDGDNWVFYDESYHQVKGWLKDGGKWYFMDKTTGFMHTGWVEDEGTWYYMNGSGAMQTGWQKIGNTWYFLKSSGAMAANEWCGGYWLNANGSWTYQPKGSWKQNSTGWWFGDTSGWYAKNTTQKIDGVDYTFNAAGYWVK